MSGLDVFYLLCLVGGANLFVYGVVSGRRAGREADTVNSYPRGVMSMVLGAALFFLPVWSQVNF